MQHGDARHRQVGAVLEPARPPFRPPPGHPQLRVRQRSTRCGAPRRSCAAVGSGHNADVELPSSARRVAGDQLVWFSADLDTDMDVVEGVAVGIAELPPRKIEPLDEDSHALSLARPVARTYCPGPGAAQDATRRTGGTRAPRTPADCRTPRAARPGAVEPGAARSRSPTRCRTSCGRTHWACARATTVVSRWLGYLCVVSSSKCARAAGSTPRRRSRLRRAVAPLTTSTSPGRTPSAVASRRATATFARPSSAGAPTLTFRVSPCRPTIPGRAPPRRTDSEST